MKVPVIYLMGAPFCGSTPLGAVLGMHPQIFNAGELLYWTGRTKKSGPCSCGQPPELCELWSVAAGQLHARNIDPNKYREHQRKNEFLRANGLWRLLRQGSLADSEEYARMTTAIFETVGETSGKAIIVDTSKHPARGMALARIATLDVTFIHLVRSGRAFVVSKMKRQKKGDPGRPGYIMQQTLNWDMTNLGIELVCRISRRPSVRLFYEDFLASPARELSKIGQLSGLDFQELGDQVAAGRLVEFGHAVSGNALRLRGPQALRREDHGGDDFPRERAWIFALLGGVLAAYYGYRGKPHGRTY